MYADGIDPKSLQHGKQSSNVALIDERFRMMYISIYFKS